MANQTQIDQESVFQELDNQYHASLTSGGEVFTFHLCQRPVRGTGTFYRFNRGNTGYTNIGIVKVGCQSRLQLVGFQTKDFVTFSLLIYQRPYYRVFKESQPVVDAFLSQLDSANPYGSITVTPGTIGSSLYKAYDWFFTEVKNYDSTNGTNFYKELKITDTDFQKERNISNTNMATVPGLFPAQLSSGGSNLLVKNIPLNQILYGPPGTGKTYHTVEKALEILAPDYRSIILNDTNLDDDAKFDKLKEKFDELKDQGRIVFTTFHQSLSYEDFIEGIKPETNKSTNQLEYPVKPGVFKSLCDKIQDDKAAYISSAGNNSSQNTKAKTGIHSPEETPEVKHERKPEKELENPVDYEKDFDENYRYVLVIDEINRGNVSQIFGELITLLEEDKRLGGKFELKVRLPYSNIDFGVPSNLYIIGTMNTADRSVEALDTALRRRFSFLEMMPDPELLKDKNTANYPVINGHSLKEILETINSRIEVLKDREHQIGHSYFMKCKDLDDLKAVFKDNIVPLLQEYFYGNYENILCVLGDGFVKTDNISSMVFARGASYDGDLTKPHYRLQTKDEWKTMNIEDAIDGIFQ